MEPVNTVVLFGLTLFAVGYAIWFGVYFVRGQRLQKKDATPSSPSIPRCEIIGKSRFVLPPRCQPTPVAASGSENVEIEEKADIFAPGNVSQHPRQIPPEKLDEVFGAPPEGERNEADDIVSPLVEAPPADYEADMDADMNMDDENEAESQPPAGRSLAKGVRFEKIGEAYRTVVHDTPLTHEKQQVVGQTLLGLKQTDMFEAIVSAHPDGNDKVTNLIDAYLTEFQRKVAVRNAGSPSPQASVPEGFDVRSYM